MFSLHSECLDASSGFHVIELRDESGAKHIVQIAVGHSSCPACGQVYPKDNLGEIDQKAMVDEVKRSLDESREKILAYAKKHGLKIKG